MKNTMSMLKEKFGSLKDNFIFKMKKMRPQSISLFLLLVCALLMLGLSRFWDPVIAGKVNQGKGENEVSGKQNETNPNFALLGGFSSAGDFNNAERPFLPGTSAGGGSGGSGTGGGSGGTGGGNGKNHTSPEPLSMSLFLLGGAALAGKLKRFI